MVKVSGKPHETQGDVKSEHCLTLHVMTLVVSAWLYYYGRPK